MKTNLLLSWLLLVAILVSANAYPDQVRFHFNAENTILTMKVQNTEEEDNQIDPSWAYYAPYYR